MTAPKNLHQKLTEKKPPSKLLQDVTSDNQPIYNKKKSASLRTFKISNLDLINYVVRIRFTNAITSRILILPSPFKSPAISC